MLIATTNLPLNNVVIKVHLIHKKTIIKKQKFSTILSDNKKTLSLQTKF